MNVVDVRRAVEAFNSRYAEMERALWILSRAAAEDLLKGNRSLTIEGFIWTIKSWWGVQGVRLETKAAAATALLELGWDHGLLEPDRVLEAGGEEIAVQQVADLVEEMRSHGVPRREWSLASKVLHWLMPWRIPVYDSFVRQNLHIPESANPKAAYSVIVRAEFEAARKLLLGDRGWLGEIEPKAPFRALDKYHWWLGGGSAGRALIVGDPWRIVRDLGLRTR